MHHTAAALAFMVQNSPVPIVLVGSQRSSDRPSSDAALNLMNGVRTAAECEIAEVMLCMFGPTSDNYDLLHRGTRCRKMHSSYRSTFRTIGATPLAMVSRQKNETGEYFTYLSDDFLRRDKSRKPIIITDRGRPVIKVSPYSDNPADLLKELRNSVVKFEGPTDPVGLEDWEILK